MDAAEDCELPIDCRDEIGVVHREVMNSISEKWGSDNCRILVVPQSLLDLRYDMQRTVLLP